ncbi:WD40 repeat-like protein [Thelephora terrestris]|uniref:DNA damage-binding protein CMR1 n=1 Tax=Thelephora terrestris TaxID=56493 RepID=A0A9P6HQW6_9AGAM|nr:WD40 repeat-like protein [Thelephora terrestris]
MPTAYELERQANIARNKALLDELALTDAVNNLGFSKKPPPPSPKAKTKAKPVQSAKRAKREVAEVSAGPRRQSARLKRPAGDPDESPEKKRARLQAEEGQRREAENERLQAEERERQARKPRHQDLELETLLGVENTEDKDGQKDLWMLKDTMINVWPRPQRTGTHDSFTYEDVTEEEREISDLKEKLTKLKIVARAKVTMNRVYCAQYHPEKSKDLIFFGDKHGQLGIWDPRAPADEVEDDEDADPDAQEGGKYWRLQMHWPATSRSSISCIRFDPTNSHSIYTSSYDCTIRCLSMGSGISKEIFSSGDVLINSYDFDPAGRVVWISDAAGGVTHFDTRLGQSKATWYGLSKEKIGSVSVNPTSPHFLLTASNSRSLRIWDTRNLAGLAGGSKPSSSDIVEYENATVEDFCKSANGSALLRAEWSHKKSVSSAYWDPRGRTIVSTSYDDTIRLWDISSSALDSNDQFASSRPFKHISHDCQTGKWLTILKAQWTQNLDVYPHFTIGNMNHSVNIFSAKGDLLANLSDRSKITAVQAVTCSHPSIIERVATGNASGRCVLWASPEGFEPPEEDEPEGVDAS